MKRSYLTVLALVVMSGCEGSVPSDGQTDQDLRIKRGPSSKVVKLVSQVNLTSNNADKYGAANMDDQLVNGWGLAFTPQGPAWVASNEKGVARIFNSEGAPQGLTVRLPLPDGKKKTDEEDHLHPTGLVFNGTNDFKGDRFIFVTEEGVISGWPAFGDVAIPRVTDDFGKANYKGAALLVSEKRTLLYAADFLNNKIDVYDDDYREVELKDDAFTDSRLPKGFAPFNVAASGGLIFVAYALSNGEGDEVAGDGLGFVDVFDAFGHNRVRLISDGALNAPWGMTFAQPASGQIARLLVGNFGDGRINSYGLTLKNFHLRAQFEGALGDAPDHPISIPGLWGIAFGTGRNGFRAEDLYFAAGPADEGDGLFGRLEPVTTRD